MPITLTVPDQIAEAAQALAEDSGLTTEQVLIRALQAHFPPMEPELAAEVAAWEQASDEDMALLDEQLSSEQR